MAQKPTQFHTKKAHRHTKLQNLTTDAMLLSSPENSIFPVEISHRKNNKEKKTTENDDESLGLKELEP